MKKILYILTAILTFSMSKGFSQSENLKTFLDAYKTYEFDESKKIIRATSFDYEVDNKMSDYNSINGVLFETDVPTLKGYKAIINCKLESKAHTFIDKRMMVVMYFDKTKNNWSVFSIREAADATQEFNLAKREVDENKFYTKKEYVYRSLAYWGMMSGKLLEAKKYIELGNIEAKATNNSTYTTNISSVLNNIL